MPATPSSARQSNERGAPLVALGLACGRADGSAAVWGAVAVGPADTGRAGCVGPGAAWAPGGRHRARRSDKLPALAGCSSCHPARGGGPLAGRRPVATPFGTFYSPNLTPDVET